MRWAYCFKCNRTCRLTKLTNYCNNCSDFWYDRDFYWLWEKNTNFHERKIRGIWWMDVRTGKSELNLICVESAWKYLNHICSRFYRCSPLFCHLCIEFFFGGETVAERNRYSYRPIDWKWHETQWKAHEYNENEKWSQFSRMEIDSHVMRYHFTYPKYRHEHRYIHNR